MKLIQKTMFLIVILFSTQACAITRSDVLECGLPDGSKFILTFKYQWSPLNKLNPHNASGREGQEDYTVQYMLKNGRTFKNVPAATNYSNLNMPSLINACKDVGLIGDIPIVNSSFLQVNGVWFSLNLIPRKLNLTPVIKEQTTEIRKQLIAIGNASPELDYAIVLPIDKQLFYEIALSIYKDEFGNTLPNGRIVAVYQSTSSDDGKTWTDPIITKDAKIYELGKPILEQSFIARPVSINGKKIEAQFPTPQRK